MSPLLHGVALFNHGEWWHAHEAWEPAWLVAREPERTRYRGLIQVAAALVHWQRGNPRGLWRNYAKARPQLIAVEDMPTIIALRRLRREMDRFVITGATPPPQIVVPGGVDAT
jgi:hypothetical protein